MSETANSDAIKEFFSLRGDRLFRNNSGALKDKSGRLIRFGLGNESEKLNDRLKSSDLIGWTPRLVTPDMVGEVIAQFMAIEVKETGWKMAGPTAEGEAAKRERAQLRFINMLRNEGGVGGFMIDPLVGFEPY